MTALFLLLLLVLQVVNHPAAGGAPLPAQLKLRVAGAQIQVTGDVTANLAAVSRAIDFAVLEKADVLLTPEGSLSGYTNSFDPGEVSRALDVVTSKARAAGLALALGTCFQEPDDRQRYNQIRFYDREGNFLGFHSKILLCKRVGNPESPSELDWFKTKPLQTFCSLDCRGG